MTTIRATLDHGELLLESPLPQLTQKLPALVVISDDTNGHDLPAQKLAPGVFHGEEDFEAIGLRDFFGDPVDERINWEKYFSHS